MKVNLRPILFLPLPLLLLTACFGVPPPTTFRTQEVDAWGSIPADHTVGVVTERRTDRFVVNFETALARHGFRVIGSNRLNQDIPGVEQTYRTSDTSVTQTNYRFISTELFPEVKPDLILRYTYEHYPYQQSVSGLTVALTDTQSGEILATYSYQPGIRMESVSTQLVNHVLRRWGATPQ